MRHPFLVLVILVVPIVAIAFLLFFTVDIAITIHDSGATSADNDNFDLTVNPDGSGQGVTNNGYGDYSYFESHTFDFAALQSSIRNRDTFIDLYIKRPACVHADSSTDIETVTYNGITSSDVACIADQNVKAAVDAIFKTASDLKKQGKV